MTQPVGVYDLITSNKAFKVSVEDAGWKWESQEVAEADALQYKAQVLF